MSARKPKRPGEAAPPNPLVAINASDTVHRVCCVLQLLERMDFEGLGPTSDFTYGHFLVLQTMTEALEAAKEQMQGDLTPRSSA